MKFTIFGEHIFTKILIDIIKSHKHQVLLLIMEEHKNLLKKTGLYSIDNIEIFYFKTILDKETIRKVELFSPDYIITAIFGYKIPAEIYKLANKGGLNVHPADLPAFRTGNAWFWPIYQGVKESAITVHLLTDIWDSGDIIYKKYFKIDKFETQGTYHQKVINLAPVVSAELIHILEKDNLIAVKQGKGSYYSKPRIKDILINWQHRAAEIENLIRACNPNHFAETRIEGLLISIVEAEVTNIKSSSPGEIILTDNKFLVATGDFMLKIKVVHQFDQGIFSAERFLNLYNIKSSQKFIPVISELEEMQTILNNQITN